MAKKDTMIDAGYTKDQVEEIKNAFIKNDITADMIPGKKPQMDEKQARTYMRVKRIFGDYWRKNLPQFGIKRLMQNYSKDFPVNLLQDADTEFFGCLGCRKTELSYRR